MTAVEHEAQVFAEGLRGGYIISQALFYGIRELEKIDPPLQEVSNLADMRFLRDNLYNSKSARKAEAESWIENRGHGKRNPGIPYDSC